MHEYKKRLDELVRDLCWNGRFSSPSQGPTEYLLDDDGCKADFCYDILPFGKLFIEDDDPARTLSNLIKYWPWASRRPETRLVYLIHIIGDSGESVYLKHCEFVAAKMRSDLLNVGCRFEYRQIRIDGGPGWHQPDRWLPEVRRVLARIAQDEGGEGPR